MIAVEVFRKKKKMEPILNSCWPVLTGDMPYPSTTEQQPAQKLVYFGQVAYAVVYESAIAAGMSSNAGHYLARLQLGRCKLGDAVARAVEATFSGFDSEEDRRYADFFHARVGEAITRIMAGESDVLPLQQELAEHFKPVAGLTVTDPP